MNELLEDQFSAINKLSKYKVGALFMRPGTGKTRAAIELTESTNLREYYWFTPFQNKANLQAEIDKWAVFPWLHHIEGTESISSSDRLYLELYQRLEKYGRRSMIIVDESLKIKNHNAKRTTRLIELGKLCEYKLILNGTPISRNLLDLWAQMEFLSPKILNMGMAEFKNTFCEYTRITKRMNGKSISREFITKYHNVEYLYSMIGHFVYEADLQLDVHKQYHIVNYNISPLMKEEYNRLKEKYLDDETLQWKRNNIFLELTQKMQHLYCNAPEKFEVVKKILDSHDRSKCIIFTKYIDSADEVSKAFPDVKVLSIQKHSLGLNLQEFNVSILWDKTWDYALIDQLEHRTFRTGQTQDCYYYHLQGDVNLESLIEKCINKKINLLDYLKKLSLTKLKQEL
jgi:SNF2 family DNA or RNA helicase